MTTGYKSTSKYLHRFPVFVIIKTTKQQLHKRKDRVDSAKEKGVN